MSTTTATGFCRVTVVAPDSRIDVALPEDVALADLYPELLRLTGQQQAAGVPEGWHLVRRDGTVLDPARTPAAQRVLDGEVLALRPFAESLPPAVHDDVADAVAAAVGRDRRRWSDDLLRPAGLGGAVLLLALAALVLWWADPVRHDMHALPGLVAGAVGVCLTAGSAVRARIYRDRGSAAALGLAAVPHLLIAGTGIAAAAPGAGPGRLQFLLGCVTVLVATALLTAVTPDGDAPFVATAVLAATGTLAAFTAVLTGARATSVAAVCVVAAVGAIAFLPALSARFARLPIGYETGRGGPGGEPPSPEPVDEARIAAAARRGHELLLGLAGGCSAVIACGAAVLGFGHSVWAQLLALAAGLATVSRARLFRHTAQIACLLTAGVGAIALLLAGLALHPPGGDRAAADVRTLWLTAAVVAGAALLAAIALIVPARGVSPFWGRVLDLAEAAVLLSLIPLCLAVLDVYAAARGMASG
ncbi:MULTISPECIES: type VII secretion integral membrane protein EccD [Streptomycetaceae]|uniref:Integral membrane protein n=1 Tax=Streptantibioticus cattleyicolor (strain ATCC 35852 / DSM 46488 / JCM 4925 / NBRC 14057 / NRRL 8057) TaxID=1003195 RepID=F8JUP4_STREN|nr:type VII secretion integral membrane protein EccD [Streptantibioticus cattleyicolor]AEW96873.1 integral membrane protein [Streptantibioticus cattleyicolor NRRL 8057 = DSM 46488]MYS61351.1 type VII secretion integral membrane protein EccD [Streptomyces sp. SID5468]CCB77202.1 Integral membrane protein [Streptantibioticus cattleyicolor NRRL 8057 = DSM 46488]